MIGSWVLECVELDRLNRVMDSFGPLRFTKKSSGWRMFKHYLHALCVIPFFQNWKARIGSDSALSSLCCIFSTVSISLLPRCLLCILTSCTFLRSTCTSFARCWGEDPCTQLHDHVMNMTDAHYFFSNEYYIMCYT